MYVMAKRKSPPEKKILSYEKDRRNTYGENSKASRKGVRRRKSWVNRTFRHAAQQRLRLTDTQDSSGDNPVDSLRREHWKKQPDTALGEILDAKTAFAEPETPLTRRNPLRKEATRRRRQETIASVYTRSNRFYLERKRLRAAMRGEAAVKRFAPDDEAVPPSDSAD
jgi:hypothetical protein